MPTLNEIMDKIGASILLSYSGLVVSCVTRDGLGFVLSKLLFISPCNRDTINTIPKSPLFAVCSFMKKHHCLVNRAMLVLSSASDQIILNMFKTFIQVEVYSWRSKNITL